MLLLHLLRLMRDRRSVRDGRSADGLCFQVGSPFLQFIGLLVHPRLVPEERYPERHAAHACCTVPTFSRFPPQLTRSSHAHTTPTRP
jgi:hypothetical protein